MASRNETQLTALLNNTETEVEIISKVDQYLKACCEKCGCQNLPEPVTRKDNLLYELADKLSHGTTPEKPYVDTTKITNLSNFCLGGNNLSFVQDENFDSRNVTNMNFTFQGCVFTTAPALNTGKVASMNNTFENCLRLETVPLIDAKSCWSFFDTFKNCTALKNISFVEGTIQVNIDFSPCTLLTAASLLSILKGIKTSVGWKTLKLPAAAETTITSDETMNALLTTIRAANWTVSFI